MSNNYEYKDRELNYVIVEELIIQLFEGKGFKKVKVFREEVEHYHLSNGGKKGVDLVYAVQSKLTKLVEDGLAEKHPKFRGEYQILGNSENVENQEQVEERDISEEPIALEKRIERLENVVLLVLSSEIGNYVGRSAEEYLRIFQSFPMRNVELLRKEYGTLEKAIENFLNIIEEKSHS